MWKFLVFKLNKYVNLLESKLKIKWVQIQWSILRWVPSNLNNTVSMNSEPLISKIESLFRNVSRSFGLVFHGFGCIWSLRLSQYSAVTRCCAAMFSPRFFGLSLKVSILPLFSLTWILHKEQKLSKWTYYIVRLYTWLFKEHCVHSLPNINVLLSYPTRPAQRKDRGPDVMWYFTTSYNKQQSQTNPRMETPLKIWFAAVREKQNKEHWYSALLLIISYSRQISSPSVKTKGLWSGKISWFP